MAICSFLVAFRNEEDIKKFYQWKDRIAQIVYDFCDIKEKKKETTTYHPDCLQVLVEFAVNYQSEYKSKYAGGDWDLNLIGFNHWKGQIWGLIQTHAPGEDVLKYLMNIILPDNFYTKPSYLPEEEYEKKTRPCLLEKTNDVEESLKLFGMLRNEHLLVDYDVLYKNEYLKNLVETDVNIAEHPCRQIDFRDGNWINKVRLYSQYGYYNLREFSRF